MDVYIPGESYWSDHKQHSWEQDNIHFLVIKVDWYCSLLLSVLYIHSIHTIVNVILLLDINRFIFKSDQPDHLY